MRDLNWSLVRCLCTSLQTRFALVVKESRLTTGGAPTAEGAKVLSPWNPTVHRWSLLKVSEPRSIETSQDVFFSANWGPLHANVLLELTADALAP